LVLLLQLTSIQNQELISFFKTCHFIKERLHDEASYRFDGGGFLSSPFFENMA